MRGAGGWEKKRTRARDCTSTGTRVQTRARALTRAHTRTNTCTHAILSRSHYGLAAPRSHSCSHPCAFITGPLSCRSQPTRNCAAPYATWFTPRQTQLSSSPARRTAVKGTCASIVYRKRVSRALEALKTAAAFALIAGARWIRIHTRSLPLTRTCPLCRTSFPLQMPR